MIETTCARWWRWYALALPRIESYVMMISSSREKYRRAPIRRRHVETEDITIKPERTLEICDGQMDVTYMSLWMYFYHENF